MRVTGIGIAANQALYLATDGRGLFWRRDVATQAPNSGVNTPYRGTVTAGRATVITTRCSYPSGWRHITALDFKLARGHGPGDGDPVAAWLEFDPRANVLRLYDPDTGKWSQGHPGAAVVLHNRFVSLDLRRSRVATVAGATPSTVEIDWSITLHKPADGALQQYLRVADDKGAATSWDKVGDLLVVSSSRGRTVVLAAVIAAVALAVVAALAVVRRRRGRATRVGRPQRLSGGV